MENYLIQFKTIKEGMSGKVPLFRLLEILIVETEKAVEVMLTQSTSNPPIKLDEGFFKLNIMEWEYSHLVTRYREEDIPYL